MAFAIPPKRFGERRITHPVTASAAQRAYERCPREDPGHTVACPFGWEGTVTLDRLTPEVDGARLTARNAAAQVSVRCATACAPDLRAGAAQKAYALPAGVTRRLTLPLRPATRATLRRGGRIRLVVAIGDERTSFTLRANRTGDEGDRIARRRPRAGRRRPGARRRRQPRLREGR